MRGLRSLLYICVSNFVEARFFSLISIIPGRYMHALGPRFQVYEQQSEYTGRAGTCFSRVYG